MRKRDRIEKLKKDRKSSGRFSPSKALNYRLELHHNRASHTPRDDKGRKRASEQLALFRIKYPELFY